MALTDEPGARPKQYEILVAHERYVCMRYVQLLYQGFTLVDVGYLWSVVLAFGSGVG